MIKQCIACDSKSIHNSFANRYMMLFKCNSCGHIQAIHKEKFTREEYHNQELDDPFLQSLMRTRRRRVQANIIVEEIVKLDNQASILDFGCGRGWFIEECLASGLKNLIGADYSKLAVENLNSKSIPSYQVTDEDFTSDFQDFSKKLNRNISLVCFLDVIEHFESKKIEKIVKNIILREEIKYVIIKIPDSKGFFFIIATFLSKFGFDKPLNQLFQVFSFPPHFQYFNRKSFFRFSEKLNLEILKEIPEKDFNLDDSFIDRIQFNFFLPKKVILLGLKAVFYVVSIFGMLDSRIYFCKKRDTE